MVLLSSVDSASEDEEKLGKDKTFICSFDYYKVFSEMTMELRAAPQIVYDSSPVDR